MTGPTRVLLAGDTHGNTSHFRYLIDAATRRDAEVVFQLGDFGYWEHEPAGVRYLDVVNACAAHAGVRIYFLDGNHDNRSLLLATYRDAVDDQGFIIVRDHVRYAPRGHRWTWTDTRFIALGGAYSIDKDWRLTLEAARDKPETLWWPDEEMTDEEMTAILAGSDEHVDVMLAHDKPREANPRWNRKNFPDCLANQNRLQRAVEALKPRLFVHGHLHYRYTDHILADDGWTTQVEGLNCDPEADMGLRPYRAVDSTLLLPLPYHGEPLPELP